MENNSVIINLKQNEIVIKISEQASKEEIEECMKEKIGQLKRMYKEETTPICITGKVLNSEEIEEIKKIINEEIDVDVQFDSPKELGLARNKKSI